MVVDCLTDDSITVNNLVGSIYSFIQNTDITKVDKVLIVRLKDATVSLYRRLDSVGD